MKKTLTKKEKSCDNEAKKAMIKKLEEYESLDSNLNSSLLLIGLKKDIESIAHPKSKLISELCELIPNGLMPNEIKSIINLL